jgi:inner membrane protein
VFDPPRITHAGDEFVTDISGALGRFFGSPGFKFFLICGLVILLLIPLFLVWALIEERQHRADSVSREVAKEWGASQFINGPALIIPYTVLRVTGQGDKRVERLVEKRATFLPQTLNINGDAKTKVLHRSIYDVAVYTGDLNVSGSFDAPDMGEVAADVQSIRWEDAVLALAISDVSGLKKTASLRIAGTSELPFKPSLGVPSTRINGIHVRLRPASEIFDAAGTQIGRLKPFSFDFALTLNGSSTLSFAPVARETIIEIKSDWPAPGFTGAFLPNDRDIDAASFSARWQIPHLARSIPQAWLYSDNALNRMKTYQFGVDFIVPVDFYQVVSRAAKYAMMFLATAFMAVFVMEIRSQRKVHAVQYLLVGIAMAFFYVLLLSFAEQIGFLFSYLIAAAATTLLISTYVGSVQASVLKGLAMLVILSLLYGLLYMILQLEDYALLAGAIAGFIMLAVVMFSTLKVDWSGERQNAG